jgi:hypothetical protein
MLDTAHTRLWTAAGTDYIVYSISTLKKKRLTAGWITIHSSRPRNLLRHPRSRRLAFGATRHQPLPRGVDPQAVRRHSIFGDRAAKMTWRHHGVRKP